MTRKLAWFFSALLFGLMPTLSAWTQGPPITADKPIMLGAGQVLVKTLTETRLTDRGNFTRIPLMVHYLPSANTLVSVHVPLVYHRFDEPTEDRPDGWTLGDIQIMGKYQFYRRDTRSKTLRMVAKTVQTLPTGKQYGIDGISMGVYQGYFSWVTGYETLKYGVSHEVGYHYIDATDDEFHHKLGFGLPLLKPTYPVNQINLYFEYNSIFTPGRDAYELLYAQGIQYAYHRFTIEAAVQFPLVQSGPFDFRRQRSYLFGTRFLF